MKLHRLSVAGFGSLIEQDFVFGPGLNVICGPNESGKTTLQMALYGALYGFYDNARSPREADALQRQYAPWRGSAYAVSLDVIVGESRLLQVSRDFRLPRRTRTTVVELRSGRTITADYPQGRSGYVGFAEKHLGVDGAAFRGCAFVTQADLALNGTAPAVCHVLGKVVTSSGDASSVEALARLAEAQQQIGPAVVARRTPYARGREEIGRLEEERQRSLTARRQQAEAMAERDEAKRQLDAVEADLALLREEQRRLRLATLLQRRETVQAIEAEREALRAAPEPAPFPTQGLACLERWRTLQAINARLAARRDEPPADAEATAALEQQLGALDANLRQLPVPASQLLANAAAIRQLAAARSAAHGARIAAEASVGAAAPAPAPRSAAAWPRVLVAIVLDALVAFAVTVALLRLHASALGAIVAGPLAGIAALAIVLAVSRAAARRSHGGGRAVAAIASRLNAAQEAARADEDRANRALDTALAAEGLPSGDAGLAALEERLDLASRRERLERTSAEVQNALERARGAGAAAAQEAARLRADVQQLMAELDALGVPPGAPVSRFAALERWRTAAETGSTARRRLAELDQRYALAIADQAPDQLENEIQALAGALHGADQHGVPATRATEAQLEANVAEQAERALALRTTVARLSGGIASILQDLREPAEIDEQLSRARAALDRLDRRYRALTIAAEELRAAQEEVHSDFAPRLATMVSEPFRQLTGSRYGQIFVDAANLQVRVQPTGVAEPVAIEQLSRGVRDQTLLLLRLAVTALLAVENEQLPVFLDEPLAHSDPERVAVLLPIIQRAARGSQVFLFTCDPRQAELARTADGVTALTLP